MISCDSCPSDNAEYSIVLNEGQEFTVCEECIPICIKDNADTDNPVHSITKLELDVIS